MKPIAFVSTAIASLLVVAAPAFAGGIYVLTVPINATGLKAGTQISVSCSGGNSFTDVKGSDANLRAAALDTNPPKDVSKVTITVGTGPADAVIPLVAGQNVLVYQCWSSYGGYVTGSLSAASSGKVTPTDSWNVGANKGS